jgi:hypothetical protein
VDDNESRHIYRTHTLLIVLYESTKRIKRILIWDGGSI